MGAPILGTEMRPDGSAVVTYGRKDFSQGQLVITAALVGSPLLQSIVDSLYDHEQFTASVVSRKQEKARAEP